MHINKYMKFAYLLLSSGIASSDKIIKNINVPACKNCIYYKPCRFDSDFTSIVNTCEKFGNKNIITDKITYDYANLCRQQDDKCGEEGKYFEKEPYIKSKIIKHGGLCRYATPLLYTHGKRLTHKILKKTVINYLKYLLHAKCSKKFKRNPDEYSK